MIQNSSFENISYPLDCNGGSFDIAGSPSFHHVVNNWYTYQSPDYFSNLCNAGTSYYNVPNNLFGISNAKTQNAYVGIGVFDIRFNYQEYIYQNLITPLKMDSVYCVSLFVSRADRLPFAIKQIGAYFSSNLPNLSSGYISAVPQVLNNTGFLTDTIGWIEIQGCFTAQGGEQYITIGNFNSNANTDTLRIQSTNPLTGTGTDVAYYYIDSVSLYQNNFPTGIHEIQKGIDFEIYPNPVEEMLNIVAIGVVGIKMLNNKESYSIKITDVLDKEVLHEFYQEQINVSTLEQGIYFISIYEKERLIKTKKLIKY